MFTPLLVCASQKIMKRLIKRYILRAQVDRESDEVNEGKRQGRSLASQRSAGNGPAVAMATAPRGPQRANSAFKCPWP